MRQPRLCFLSTTPVVFYYQRPRLCVYCRTLFLPISSFPELWSTLDCPFSVPASTKLAPFRKPFKLSLLALFPFCCCCCLFVLISVSISTLNPCVFVFPLPACTKSFPTRPTRFLSRSSVLSERGVGGGGYLPLCGCLGNTRMRSHPRFPHLPSPSFRHR